MQSLWGTSPIHKMSSPQSQPLQERWVFSGDSTCSVRFGSWVSVFDNIVDSHEELEFEENLSQATLHSARCASPEQILAIG